MHIEQKITELTEAVNRLNLNLETLIRMWPKPAAGTAQPAATVTPIGQAAQDATSVGTPKRGPGRPPGSGKAKATLAAVPNGADTEGTASEFEQGPAQTIGTQIPVMDYTSFKEQIITLFNEGRDSDAAVAILRAAPPKGFGKQAFTDLTPEEYPRMLEAVKQIPVTPRG